LFGIDSSQSQRSDDPPREDRCQVEDVNDEDNDGDDGGGKLGGGYGGGDGGGGKRKKGF
jgi:hypothetical protein